METLSGVIERVVFHNDDNGFTVLRVQTSDGVVAMVGHMPSAVAGEHVEASGAWVRNRDHGQQFQAEKISTKPPDTVAGIEKYLASGLIKGIGKRQAKKIITAFGARTLKIIDESPAFLKEIKGMSAERIARVRASWQEQKAVREIMMFLQGYGIGTARAHRIYKTYGDKAIEKVRENPYRLATDIWGVGFQTADEIAQRIGIDRASPLRARAALNYTLKTLSDEGHCGFPEEAVIERTAGLVNIDRDIIVKAVDHQCQNGDVIRERWSKSDDPRYDSPWLYLRALHHAETGVAAAVKMLSQGEHPLPTLDMDDMLAWTEKRIGLELAPSQREAIRQAMTNKLLVITGGPGVGKTTIVRGILEIFAAHDLHCELCAPTGRAAKRLSETTGRQARTIHRLLEFEPHVGVFMRGSLAPLKTDLLIVDESSMVDISLMYHLLEAVPPTACVVLVGDVDQLPSVGPGTVLADLINSGAVPVARLTEIFRQAAHSGIVRAAHAVNNGQMPESASAEQPGDFYFVESEKPEELLRKIVTLVRDRIPARFGLNAVNDVQVLTPMHKSELGTKNLNALLQDVLNPLAGQAETEQFGCKFRVGDKVMQKVNNYDKEVFNGDLGRITGLDVNDKKLTVAFDDGAVDYGFDEVEELMPAYCTTIHKAQGSEYPAVVIPLHTQHFIMLQRNLLYTAITRGKKLVVLVGMRRALQLAVERQNTAQRCTGLRQRLSSLVR
ncbi:MAG TPA: ATP-dependent RecD-like DNA helicase [Gemmataceae bacterium]|nr:ATP-dependent RecD-like DNA helicase [Gemmataceae bacterium]